MKYVPGVLSALQRCLLETSMSVYDTIDHSMSTEVLSLLENISLLLLGVLYGDLDVCATEMGIGVIRRYGFGDVGYYISHLFMTPHSKSLLS